MKKTLLLFSLLFSLSAYSQNDLLTEEDLKLDASILNGFVLNQFPDKLIKIGFRDNPGIYNTPNTIRYLLKGHAENVLDVYVEAYVNPKNEGDDAGVIISRFDSEQSLKLNLPSLVKQDNVAYLTKDTYLIEVWSDASQNSETQISDMVKYYIDKLGAEVYQAQKTPPIEYSETEEVNNH